jgi:hypothetical protein
MEVEVYERGMELMAASIVEAVLIRYRLQITSTLPLGLLVISAGDLFASPAVIRPGDPRLNDHGQRIQATAEVINHLTE